MALINWNWVSPEMAANSVKSINDAANANYEENQKRQANAIAAQHIDVNGNITPGYYKAAADAGLGFDKIKQAAEYYTGQNAQNAQNVTNYNVIKRGGGDPGTTRSKTGLAAIYQQPPVAQPTVAQQPTASPHTGPLSANHSVLDDIFDRIKSVFSLGGDKKPDDSSKEVIPSTDANGTGIDSSGHVIVPAEPGFASVGLDGKPVPLSPIESAVKDDQGNIIGYTGGGQSPYLPVREKSAIDSYDIHPSAPGNNSYLQWKLPWENVTWNELTKDGRLGDGTPVRLTGQYSTGNAQSILAPDPVQNAQQVTADSPDTQPQTEAAPAALDSASSHLTGGIEATTRHPADLGSGEVRGLADNDQPWFYNSYDAWKDPFDKTAGADSPDTYASYFDVSKVVQTGNKATNEIPYSAAFKAAMGTLGQGSDQDSVDSLFKLSDATVPVPTGAFMPGADGKVNVQAGMQALSDYKAKLEEKRLELAKALQKGDADQISTILGYKNLDIAKSNLGIAKENLEISKQKNEREKLDFSQKQEPIVALKKAGWHNVNANNVDHAQALATTEGRLVGIRSQLQDIIKHPDKHKDDAAMVEAGVLNTLLSTDGATTEGARDEIKLKANMMAESGLLQAYANGREDGAFKWLTANGTSGTAQRLLDLTNNVITSGKDAQDAFRNYGHPFGAAPTPKPASAPTPKPASAPKVPGIPQAKGNTPKVNSRDNLGRVWTGKRWIVPGAR